MWKKIPQCRKHKYCPLMEKSEEHLVYLIFDYHEGGESLPLTNGRYMTSEMALNIIRMEMGTAIRLGKEKMRIVFRGGDPFRRFSELKEICESAWKQGMEYNLDVIFELTVRPENFTDKNIQWYMENAKTLSLWIRCESETFASDIVEVSENFGCGIDYQADMEQIKNALLDVWEVQRKQIPVRLQVKVLPEEWKKDTAGKYEMFLQELLRISPDAKTLPWTGDILRIIEAKEGFLGNELHGRCYDPNGWQWTCPMLSQLNHYSWNMDEEKLQEIIKEQPETAMKWICPGELLKWGEKRGYLLEKRILEYSFGIQVLKREEDEMLDALVRDLLAEARERE